MAIITRECKVNGTQLGVDDTAMYQSIKAMFDRQGITPDTASKVWLKDDTLANTSCVYVYVEEKEVGGDVHSVPAGFAQEVTWQTVLNNQ